MTRQGWTHVCLRTETLDRLRDLARERGQSVSGLISDYANGLKIGLKMPVSKLDNWNPSYVPTQQMDAKRTSFPEREGMETVGFHSMAGPAGFEPATTDSGGQRHILVIPALLRMWFISSRECRLDHGPDMNRRTTYNKTC